MNIWLHAGSGYNSGSIQDSWGALNQAGRATGISSFFDSTDREFFITGVQFELGEVATPFEHETFGDNLQRCQRYFYKFLSTISNSINLSKPLSTSLNLYQSLKTPKNSKLCVRKMFNVLKSNR